MPNEANQVPAANAERQAALGNGQVARSLMADIQAGKPVDMAKLGAVLQNAPPPSGNVMGLQGMPGFGGATSAAGPVTDIRHLQVGPPLDEDVPEAAAPQQRAARAPRSLHTARPVQRTSTRLAAAPAQKASLEERLNEVAERLYAAISNELPGTDLGLTISHNGAVRVAVMLPGDENDPMPHTLAGEECAVNQFGQATLYVLDQAARMVDGGGY